MCMSCIEYGYVVGSLLGLITDHFQYACLVPDCDRLCSTPQKRRLHCIDKHQFPRNYDFFIVNDGIDRRSSMLRPPHRRRSSAFSSVGDGTSRRRGESFASAGEGMELVRDEDEDQNAANGNGDGESRRIPVRLRGRGGFSHPVGRGRGSTSKAQDAAKTASTPADPVDGIASSLSALQFVPPSVRMAHGRGKGQGS